MRPAPQLKIESAADSALSTPIKTSLSENLRCRSAPALACSRKLGEHTDSLCAKHPVFDPFGDKGII